MTKHFISVTEHIIPLQTRKGLRWRKRIGFTKMKSLNVFVALVDQSIQTIHELLSRYARFWHGLCL